MIMIVKPIEMTVEWATSSLFEIIFLFFEKRRKSHLVRYVVFESLTLIITTGLLIVTCILTTPYSNSTGVSKFGILELFIVWVQLFHICLDILVIFMLVLPSFHIYIGYYNPFSYHCRCRWPSRENRKCCQLLIIGSRFVEKLHAEKKKPHDDYYFSSYSGCCLMIEIVCSTDFSKSKFIVLVEWFLRKMCCMMLLEKCASIELKTITNVRRVSSISTSKVIDEQSNPFNISHVSDESL